MGQGTGLGADCVMGSGLRIGAVILVSKVQEGWSLLPQDVRSFQIGSCRASRLTAVKVNAWLDGEGRLAWDKAKVLGQGRGLQGGTGLEGGTVLADACAWGKARA